ncbi:MAG TPA: NIPSNAP family protein [Kiritimatiellia bacterium]|nr:NIPSNAP family protein [Kiritimatiellia bacterium]
MRCKAVLAGMVCAAGLAGLDARAQETAGPREWIQIKTYVCGNVAKREALVQVFDRALIPALNRQGIRKVGVFWSDAEVNDGNAAYETRVVVVIPHPDGASFAGMDDRLLADAQYMKDAAPLFSAPMNDPLYDSCSSALLRGFATCPQVRQVTDAPERLLQLRIYNSYTIERNAKKIAMFEGGGELAIFRTCGMEPVFFGQGLAGDQLPNLTYMLGFADKAAKETAWKTFVNHPDWKKLKVDPQYKDTANKITNILLRPSKGSQL